jgi:hypothetical protein
MISCKELMGKDKKCAKAYMLFKVGGMGGHAKKHQQQYSC